MGTFCGQECIGFTCNAIQFNLFIYFIIYYLFLLLLFICINIYFVAHMIQKTSCTSEHNSHLSFLFSFRQFKKAVTDAIMSRRAIRNMNTL